MKDPGLQSLPSLLPMFAGSPAGGEDINSCDLGDVKSSIKKLLDAQSLVITIFDSREAQLNR